MAQKHDNRPHYPLEDIKEKIRVGHVEIKPNALEDANYYFEWGPKEIKQCYLKLNDLDYTVDKNNNHFAGKGPHKFFQGVMIDIYKAKNILDGENIYTHFYVSEDNGKVVINSFHDLDD